MSHDSLETLAREAEQVIAESRADAHDYMVAALGRTARHEFEAAEALFQHALALEPGNPAVLTGLAVLRRKQGRLRDAVLACDAAIRSVPHYPDAWLERGAILASGGSNSAARDSFAEAARLAPNLAQAHAGLAGLAAREGDEARARKHAQDALLLDPTNAVATCALASADLTAKQPQRVIPPLQALIARSAQPSPDRSFAWGLLGDAFDQLQDVNQAYHAYCAAKADFAAVNAPMAEGQPGHRQFVASIHSGLAAVPTAQWQGAGNQQPAHAAEKHVFLLGYPRSGTTLMENVLASLPGVEALEERPTLSAVDRTYLMGDHAFVVAGMKRFASLDEGSIAALCRDYWEGVVASGVSPNARCFVDMDPLKGTRLPFIAKMFPQSRILIMRRDPRDVVWSCFRTNFAMTSGTLEFTSLERAARHYAAMMSLTEEAVGILDLNVMEVHYHRLVQDFDQTTREVCDFLGLEWSETLRSFDRTAQNRGVATASSSQVRRGLYDGTRQWERYAEYLEPVLPILDPWIERFGYA